MKDTETKKRRKQGENETNEKLIEAERPVWRNDVLEEEQEEMVMGAPEVINEGVGGRGWLMIWFLYRISELILCFVNIFNWNRLFVFVCILDVKFRSNVDCLVEVLPVTNMFNQLLIYLLLIELQKFWVGSMFCYCF